MVSENTQFQICFQDVSISFMSNYFEDINFDSDDE